MPTNEPGGIGYERDMAEMQAWRALAAGDYVMFGYWASTWSLLNDLTERKQVCPFQPLVQVGRAMVCGRLRDVKDHLRRRRGDAES